MSTKKLTLTCSAFALLVFAGCGRNYSGVYQGQEQINQGSGLQAQSGSVVMTLSESNGSTVTGTYQSNNSTAGGAGQVNATATGSGLTNFSLIMQGGFGVSMFNVGGCQTTYTGTLNSPNGNELTGILVGTGGCSTGFSLSRSIDVTK